MVNKLKTLPKELRDILKVVSNDALALGVKVYLVGGVVRDLLLGRSIFDLDIVVEGDAFVIAQRVAKHFNKDFRRHHAFGTAAVYFEGHKIDFATARSEYYSHWGVLPKVSPADLKKDLSRRDFTINAMAIGLNKDDYGKLVDFYEGKTDLANKSIKVLYDNSFLDDPTRILRAIRFEQRFSFKLDKKTARLMKDALRLNALSFVHSHRLSDEFVIILKEPKPYSYIKRLYALTGFSFLGRKLKMTEVKFNLFRRIERAHFKLKKIAKIEAWVVYLAAVLVCLSRREILDFFRAFGLRKADMVKVLAVKENMAKVKSLNRKLVPHKIYHLLKPLSMETIVFFYAYYPQKRIRENIVCFLRKLTHIYLKVRGDDLKQIGIKPLEIYSRVLQQILYLKIDKGLKTKQQEIREVKRVFKGLIKNAK